MPTADPQTVYIVAGDSAVSHSARFLLETHLFLVKTVKTAERTLTQIPLREQDIIMLDLDNDKPAAYRLLNDLMTRVKRPSIVLTTAMKSALKATDVFPGERVQLLFHPVAPKTLLSAVHNAASLTPTQ